MEGWETHGNSEFERKRIVTRKIQRALVHVYVGYENLWEN